MTQTTLNIAPAIAIASNCPGAGKDTLFDSIKTLIPSAVNHKFATALITQLARHFWYPRQDIEAIILNREMKDTPLHLFAITSLNSTSQYRKFLLPKYDDHYGARSIRWHLIQYGTEFVRNHLGEKDFWVEQLIASLKHHKDSFNVVTDVRFPNELAALKNLGTKIVYIQKTFDTPHISDITERLIAPDDADIILIREPDTTPEQMLEQLIQRLFTFPITPKKD